MAENVPQVWKPRRPTPGMARSPAAAEALMALTMSMNVLSEQDDGLLNCGALYPNWIGCVLRRGALRASASGRGTAMYCSSWAPTSATEP